MLAGLRVVGILDDLTARMTIAIDADSSAAQLIATRRVVGNVKHLVTRTLRPDGASHVFGGAADGLCACMATGFSLASDVGQPLPMDRVRQGVWECSLTPRLRTRDMDAHMMSPMFTGCLAQACAAQESCKTSVRKELVLERQFPGRIRTGHVPKLDRNGAPRTWASCSLLASRKRRATAPD